MFGLSGAALTGIASNLFSAFTAWSNLSDTQAEVDAMKGVNSKISGGKESEVAKDVTQDGKTDNAANFLKSAGNLGNPLNKNKNSGLGFRSA